MRSSAVVTTIVIAAEPWPIVEARSSDQMTWSCYAYSPSTSFLYQAAIAGELEVRWFVTIQTHSLKAITILFPSLNSNFTSQVTHSATRVFAYLSKAVLKAHLAYL